MPVKLRLGPDGRDMAERNIFANGWYRIERNGSVGVGPDAETATLNLGENATSDSSVVHLKQTGVPQGEWSPS
jgi:hypothetical protein